MTAVADDFDIIVVGAGVSGISAAWHLQHRCPGKRYAVLEARDDIGGTWDFFKYPGLRSDSDMRTFGFRFRPWIDNNVFASAPAIMGYLRDTVRESGVDRRIRHGHRVVGADWSSQTQRWTLRVLADGRERTFTSAFLVYCGGYYRYDGGYTPDFPGMADFAGRIVHPNQWPRDLDWAGERVVVVGSGATAVTVLPELAKTAAHVTMLQRSPTYILPAPPKDKLAERLSRLLPPASVHRITRWRNILYMIFLYKYIRRDPAKARAWIRSIVARALPEGYPVDVHFNPAYDPWDQRICFAPGGDLYRAIGKGAVSVVTSHIDRFTERGVLLRGPDGRAGEELEADIVVTATGFNVQVFADTALSVDGVPLDLPSHVSYKALMLNDVPNLTFTIGYTNASWTLKADLVSEYTVRLIRYLDRHGYGSAAPTLDRPLERTQSAFGDFRPGYVLRSEDALPRQGPTPPWRLRMNYLLDVLSIRFGRIKAPQLRFTPRRGAAVGPDG